MAGELVQGSVFGVATLLPPQVRNKLYLQNWDPFQIDCAMRIRMLSDNWEDQLVAYIIRQINDELVLHFFKGLNSAKPKWPLPPFNLFKRVIEEISLIYKNQAQRWFEIGIDAPDAKGGMEITGTDQIAQLLATPPITPPNPDSSNQNAPQPQLPPSDPQLPPTKTFSHDERWEQIADPAYNAMMQRVNELVNSVNVVLVRPIPDPEKETGFNYHILTGDMFRPIQDPHDPSNMIGVLYAIDLTDSGNQAYLLGYYAPINSLGTTPTRLQVLIFKGYTEVHNGQETYHEPFIAQWYNDDPETLVKSPYPYFNEDGDPILPFATFRRETPLTGEFVNRTKGSDLVTGTLMVGYMSSLWVRQFQGNTIKQVWVTGTQAADMTTTMIRDTNVIQVIPIPKDQVDIVMQDFQTDINAHFESLQLLIDTIIGAYGLSRDKWKSSPVSGESLKVQNQPIIHRIQSQITHYRQGETELANIIRDLNNTILQEISNKFEKINSDAEFKIQFGELPFQETPMDTIDKLLMLVDRNLLSLAEVAIELDPELGTLEDAQIAILRNKQMNKQVAPPPMPPAIGGAPGQPPPAVQQKNPMSPNPLIGGNQIKSDQPPQNPNQQQKGPIPPNQAPKGNK